jgi:hypothetical protein
MILITGLMTPSIGAKSTAVADMEMVSIRIALMGPWRGVREIAGRMEQSIVYSPDKHDLINN